MMDKQELTDKMGKLTLVTPPSMVRPKDISFTIINLNEEQKTIFTDKLNELFPKNEITIFIWDKSQVEDRCSLGLAREGSFNQQAAQHRSRQGRG